jgi:hypothetical protein
MPHAHAIAAYLPLPSQGGQCGGGLPQVGLLAGVWVGFLLIAIWHFRFE